jgi:hypothetical protein
MSLGVHFALSKKDLERLHKIDDADELVEFISEDLEERYLEDDQWSYQSDKSWDAIHRCLTDGQLLYESGPFPLAYAVLGGTRLATGDEYTACLVSAEQVAKTTETLRPISREWLRDRYQKLSASDYADSMSDDDFEYTWENFEGLRTFFEKASKAGRAVLFTTDA